MNRWMILGALVPLILGCSTVGSHEGARAYGDPVDNPLVYRRLAWMEGDLQSGYEPNRSVAESRLKRWEGKTPDVADTTQYLKYLAVLDASGQSTDVEEKIKAYLAGHPNEKRAVFLLGVHYLRAKKMELANYFFGQLEKDPGFAWKSLLLNNLGMMALKEGNRVQAIDYFERAVREKPPIAAPHANLGAMYLESRNYEAAEKMFSQALKIDDQFEDAVLGLGSALEGQGKYTQAYEVYDRFISDHSDALSVLYNQSLVLGNRLNRRSEAAELMLRYIQRGGKESAEARRAMEQWQ